jgi:hypothetical protein
MWLERVESVLIISGLLKLVGLFNITCLRQAAETALFINLTTLIVNGYLTYKIFKIWQTCSYNAIVLQHVQ